MTLFTSSLTPTDQIQYNTTINQYIKAICDGVFGYGIISLSDMMSIVYIIYVKYSTRSEIDLLIS